MSAFVGFTSFSKSWRLSKDDVVEVDAQLAQRADGAVQSVDASNAWMRCRSKREGDFFSDDDVCVAVDGTIDWIDIEGIEDEECHNESARVFASLYKERGLDWVEHVQGTFAIAIVDRKKQSVSLIRDKFGTKPLLYANTVNGWVWGSRIAAFKPFLDSRKLDYQALSEVVHYRWLIGDRKLLKGVSQVLQSHVVTLDASHHETRQRYWQLKFASKGGDLEYWIDKTDAIIHEYFERMSKRYSNVGILLSAGVDSSLIAAIGSKYFPKMVAVTPKWTHGENPELGRAQSFAEHLGIEHITPDVDDAFIAKRYRSILSAMEEPCRYYHGLALAKALDSIPKGVEAVMYGEAADTMFGSRPVDFAIQFSKRQRQISSVPGGLRRALGDLIPARSGGRWGRFRDYLSCDYEHFVHRIHALESQALPSSVFKDVSDTPRANPGHIAGLLADYEDPISYAQAHLIYTSITNHFEAIDRLASHHSYDLMHPFICHSLLQAASDLPPELQIVDGVVKPVLRELACRYFPREWIYEPKIGFAVPTQSWLKGPLQGEFELLREERTRARGLINVDALLKLPLEHNYELYYTAMGLERVLRDLVD